MITLHLQAFAVAPKEFPGRDLYPLIPYLEIDDLYSKFDEVVIVDVRSNYEFETLRIKGALNIPLSSITFVQDMRNLRDKDPRPIVVYCNGKTCMKSYKAVEKCAVNKIDNVHAFDAGIMDWARTYPKQSVLLGKNPVNPNKLISKDEFRKHLLSPDQYGERVASSSAIVLDVRDRFQREGLSLFVGRERRAYLDDTKTLDRYINKAKRENKTLLVHDAAGKQVQWLQYYLKDKGLSNYYFMQGGTSAYYEQMKQEFIR
ncbi:rhodanese-like domain-containing protein [Kaarinaea lacus]